MSLNFFPTFGRHPELPKDRQLLFEDNKIMKDQIKNLSVVLSRLWGLGLWDLAVTVLRTASELPQVS